MSVNKNIYRRIYPLKKTFLIVCLSLTFLFINIGHASFLDTLKEKREKAIEHINIAKNERQIELQQNRKKLVIDNYSNYQSFHSRKLIFIISISCLWVFILIYAIGSKTPKKIQ